MGKDKAKLLTKGVVLLLDTVLKKDANSASCIISFQPQAPMGIERFKKNAK